MCMCMYATKPCDMYVHVAHNIQYDIHVLYAKYRSFSAVGGGARAIREMKKTVSALERAARAIRVESGGSDEVGLGDG